MPRLSRSCARAETRWFNKGCEGGNGESWRGTRTVKFIEEHETGRHVVSAHYIKGLIGIFRSTRAHLESAGSPVELLPDAVGLRFHTLHGI